MYCTIKFLLYALQNTKAIIVNLSLPKLSYHSYQVPAFCNLTCLPGEKEEDESSGLESDEEEDFGI